jgi:hypothetical protein
LIGFFGLCPLLDATAPPQHEILEDEFPITRRKGCAAGSAAYFSVPCLRASFDFDHLIERIAVWAIERTWLATHHHSFTGKQMRHPHVTRGPQAAGVSISKVD